MQETQALLTKTYSKFNARDIASVLEGMHPDVDWPNGIEGGRVLGHDAVREYWTRQWQMIDPRVDAVGFAPDGEGNTVVSVHQVIRDREGKLLMDRMVEHIYRVEDGLIRRMDIREPETT